MFVAFATGNHGSSTCIGKRECKTNARTGKLCWQSKPCELLFERERERQTVRVALRERKSSLLSAPRPPSAFAENFAMPPGASAPIKRVALGFYGLVRDNVLAVAMFHDHLISPLKRSPQLTVDTFVCAIQEEVIYNPPRNHFHRVENGAAPDARRFARLLDSRTTSVVNASKYFRLLSRSYYGARRPFSSYESKHINAHVLMARMLMHMVSRQIRTYERDVGIRYDIVACIRNDVPPFVSVRPVDFYTVPPHTIIVPNVQQWGGVNERFFYGDAATMRYSMEAMWDAIGHKNASLYYNAESLFAAVLRAKQINVRTASLCFVRVRLGGHVLASDLEIQNPERPQGVNTTGVSENLACLQKRRGGVGVRCIRVLTFNRASSLKSALDSINNMHFKNGELVPLTIQIDVSPTGTLYKIMPHLLLTRYATY